MATLAEPAPLIQLSGPWGGGLGFALRANADEWLVDLPYDEQMKEPQAIPDLERMAHAIPIMSEASGTAALLEQSLNLLGTFASNISRSEPFLACLAAGMEKLCKLTYLLSEFGETGKFPTKQTMKDDFGHDIRGLDEACREIILRRIPGTPSERYVSGLLDQAEDNELLPLIIDAVTDYAKSGRFYNLDAIADAKPDRPSPVQLWERTERAIIEGRPHLYSGPADLTVPMTEVVDEIRGSSALAIRQWWALYADAWNGGALGREAQMWSVHIRALDG